MQIKYTNSNTTENPNATENNGQAESGKLPYSYHTFVYPFEFDGNLLETNDKKREKNNKKTSCKLGVDLLIEDTEPDSLWEKETNIDDEVNVDRYNIYNYFTAKARNIIFNTGLGSDTSCHYKYKKEKGTKAYYIISYKEKTDKENTPIVLDIRDIKLAIFPRVNIGILILETENDDDIATENVDEDDNIISFNRFKRFERVCKINEFGRRLFSPSINEERQTWIDATNLSIEWRKDESETAIKTISSDYSVIVDECLKITEQKKYEYKFLKFLQDILGKSVMEKLQGIKPIIDERMFVNCIVRDDKIGKLLQQYDEEKKEYDIFQADKSFTVKDLEKNPIKNKSALLYSFVFVDKSHDECSCQNKTMRIDLLKQHVYGRWIDKDTGTIQGITEHSFVSITGEYSGLKDSVINPFLTQYTRMAIIALVQRAALNKIEEDIVDVCESKYTKIDIDTDKITKVWEKFVIFQNLLFLPEVTFQEQGAELYAYLKKAFKLETLNAQIENELDNLHEYAELIENKEEKKRSDTMNDSLAWLALLAVVSAITDGTVWIHGMVEKISSAAGNTLFEKICVVLAGNNCTAKKFDLGLNFVLIVVIWVIVCKVLKPLLQKKWSEWKEKQRKK